MAWRVANSLLHLRDEVNAKYPSRSKFNDGTIGDAAHQSRASDHNPWVSYNGEGIVTAMDLTHDPKHGFDSYKFADEMRLSHDKRIKYIISNRRIAGNENYAKRNGVKPWTWVPYHGANPHDEHVHTSVESSQPLFDDVSDWHVPMLDGTPQPPPNYPHGSDEWVQATLNKLGYGPLDVDGDIGPKTSEALRKFQLVRGIAPDGLVGPETIAELDRTLEGKPPKPTPPSPAKLLADIENMAGRSEIARYDWKGRGRAPIGYTKGMAVTFARAYQRFKAGDPAVTEMAEKNTFDDRKDALSWYASKFRDAKMSNAQDGPDTLRHVFTLLMGLGMRESSGQYGEGRDVTAANPTAEGAEAGLFQQSWDSHGASPYIQGLLDAYRQADVDGLASVFAEGARGATGDYGSGSGEVFQHLAKSKPAFAVMAAAIGLRVIGGKAPYGHWGPIRRYEAELRPEADAMFKQVQALVDASTGIPV